MDYNSQQMLQASTHPKIKTYVDEVFAIDTWRGEASDDHEVKNGIDLVNNKGLVWIKNRTTGHDFVHFDTLTGVSGYRKANQQQETSESEALVEFKTTGYVVGNSNWTNQSDDEIWGWTWRAAPGFFDIVEYTGNSSTTQQISHELGSQPGLVVVFPKAAAAPWMYARCGVTSTNHASVRSGWYLGTPNEDGQSTPTPFTAAASLTAAQFGPSTVEVGGGAFGDITLNGQACAYNTDGTDYLMLLWATGNDSAAAVFGEGGNEAIIKMVEYTTADTDYRISLGWEPQLHMGAVTVAADSRGRPWGLQDSLHGGLKGWYATDEEYFTMTAHDFPEQGTNGCDNEGFEFPGGKRWMSYYYDTFWGMCVRRPDNKVGFSVAQILARDANIPEPDAVDAEHIFSRSGITGSSSSGERKMLNAKMKGGFDYIFFKCLNLTDRNFWHGFRALGWKRYIDDNSETGSAIKTGESSVILQTGYRDENGYEVGTENSINGGAGKTHSVIAWKRAPGYFDCYTFKGDGVEGTSRPHALGVKPEVIIIKNLQDSSNCRWVCWFGAGNGAGDDGATDFSGKTNQAYHTWNDDQAYDVYTGNGPTATASTWKTGAWAEAGCAAERFIVMFFASLSGYSKMGDYDGTGADDNHIECGFQPRTVIIKRDTGTNDGWLIFGNADTRTITTGTDKYIALGTTSAEQDEGENIIQPYTGGTGGFSIMSAQAEVNTSGTKYLYMAFK